MPAIILRIVHGLFLDAFDIPENIFFRDSELLMFRGSRFLLGKNLYDFEWNSFELLLYRLYYSFKEEIER